MGKKKKEFKIIRKDSNKEEYNFVSSDNILNNVINLKDNESTTTTTTITTITNEKKSENKPDERIEKKIHSKKTYYKGRKILGKSLQGHSPVYE